MNAFSGKCIHDLKSIEEVEYFSAFKTNALAYEGDDFGRHENVIVAKFLKRSLFAGRQFHDSTIRTAKACLFVRVDGQLTDKPSRGQPTPDTILIQCPRAAS